MPVLDVKSLQKTINTILDHSDLSEEHKKIFKDEYFSPIEDPVLKMVIRFLNRATPDIGIFTNFIQDNIKYGILNYITYPCPIFCLSPDITKIRVFPNLILRNLNTRKINNITMQLSLKGSILEPFLDNYLEAKKHPKKYKMWENFTVSWKRIKKYEDIPTSQFLSKYCNIPEKIMGGDRGTFIRQVANSIDEVRKPLELLYADTPEDFYDMYKEGPSSCMSFMGHTEREKIWKPLLEKGLCPTSFFAYCPMTRGVYTKRGDSVTNRAILYHINNEWYYGRIFSQSNEVASTFRMTLQKHDIKPLLSAAVFQKEHAFSIPGIKVNNYYICPYPYFDNMAFARNAIVHFENETFYFSQSGEHHPIDRTGMLISTDYMETYCSYCNKAINVHQDKISPAKAADKQYCCPSCANDAGYFLIKSGTGTEWGQKTNTEITDTTRRFLFTTQTAAEAGGFITILRDPFIIPEDGSLVCRIRDTYDTRYINSLGVINKQVGISNHIYNEYPGSILPRPSAVPVSIVNLQTNLTFDTEASIFC